MPWSVNLRTISRLTENWCELILQFLSLQTFCGAEHCLGQHADMYKMKIWTHLLCSYHHTCNRFSFQAYMHRHATIAYSYSFNFQADKKRQDRCTVFSSKVLSRKNNFSYTWKHNPKTENSSKTNLLRKLIYTNDIGFENVLSAKPGKSHSFCTSWGNREPRAARFTLQEIEPILV